MQLELKYKEQPEVKESMLVLTIKNYERKISKLDKYYKSLDENNVKYLKKIENLEKLIKRQDESESRESSMKRVTMQSIGNDSLL